MDGRITLDIEGIMGDLEETPTALTEKYLEMLEDEEEEDPREPALRPSSMPFCSIILLNAYIAWYHGEGSWGMSGDFYTSIGTQVHEIIQKWIPRQGDLVGNWVCPACEKTRKVTTENECECGSMMNYEEIEVRYQGVTGHIDTVLLLESLKYLICDYKTSSMKKILAVKEAENDEDRDKAIDRLVSKNYLVQILVYALICEELYGWEIEGCSLLFIPRDNPFEPLEVFVPWTRKRKHQVEHFLKSQVTAFKAAKLSFDTLDYKPAVKNRACKNQKHYDRQIAPYFPYGGCQLQAVCVITESLKPVSGYLKKELDFIREDEAKKKESQ